jgi:Kelch motif
LTLETLPRQQHQHQEYPERLILPADSPLAHPEFVQQILPGGKVLVDGRRVQEMENYYEQYKLPNTATAAGHVKIYENYILSPTEEPGSCQLGTQLWLVGGINVTRWTTSIDFADAALGSTTVLVYDMQTQSTVFGPPLPFRANHMPCAANAKDGILHVTGGFRQDAPRSHPGAHSRHWILDTRQINPQWESRAPMPNPRGAHGCVFLNDGKMYCVGGGIKQWGTFTTELQIYDPVTNAWTLGPPMHVPRDHIMQLVSLYEDNAIYVVGGRTDVSANSKPEPYFWKMASSAEIYDLRTNQWTIVHGPGTSRAGAVLVSHSRKSPSGQQHNTVLVVGGERHIGFSGQVVHSMDEFDPEVSDTLAMYFPLQSTSRPPFLEPTPNTMLLFLSFV